MSLYRDIIARALTMSWRAKFLWLLAFLAALVGNGGSLEILFSGSDSFNGQTLLLNTLRAFYQNDVLSGYMANIRHFFSTYPLASVLVVLLTLIVIAFVIWLILVAQGALVSGIAKLQNKTPTDFGDVFSTGMKVFPSVFLINLATALVVFVLLGAIAVPFGIAFIRTGGNVLNSFYIVSSFIILVPFSVILAFITNYAVIHCVVRQQRWNVALKNGWHMFIHNWLVSIEIAAILFVINLVTSLTLVFLLFTLGLPTNPAGFVIFSIILVTFGALLSTFQYATWVLLFLGIEAGTVKSKLLRWVESMTKSRAAVKPAAK